MTDLEIYGQLREMERLRRSIKQSYNREMRRQLPSPSRIRVLADQYAEVLVRENETRERVGFIRVMTPLWVIEQREESAT